MTENLARFNADLEASTPLLLVPEQQEERRGVGIETHRERSVDLPLW